MWPRLAKEFRPNCTHQPSAAAAAAAAASVKMAMLHPDASTCKTDGASVFFLHGTDARDMSEGHVAEIRPPGRENFVSG